MATTLDRLAYKVKTFAALIECSERFVKQEIYDGNLKAFKAGGHWRITNEAARAYMGLKEEAREQDETLASVA